ncbi:three-helix bundle dimerization domain-containing protein [Rhodococcus erythropolis]
MTVSPAHVRDFVPLLVEQRAKESLAAAIPA